LRKKALEQFGAKTYDDFMFHNPVSVQELAASVIPGEHDWRLDFSEGYNQSRWNVTLRQRIIALTLQDQDEETAASVDNEWLDHQLKAKFADMREKWRRLQPKFKGDGMETAAEAALRTTNYMMSKQLKKKSNSAKFRVRVFRSNCLYRCSSEF
jgi:hypothetical protein